MRTIPTIHLIAAVGIRGEIGVNGELPWHDSEDLRWFKFCTTGHTVIFGPKTLEKLPPLPGRTVLADDRNLHPMEYLKVHGLTDPKSLVFIGGGTNTYKRWMPFVDRCIISKIKWTGQADAYMPPLWETPNSE